MNENTLKSIKEIQEVANKYGWLVEGYEFDVNENTQVLTLVNKGII